ncbi:MAG: hypothetical protein Q8933_09400 [Bacteroidota bacterium]|nr:hypothetical protein [Bacteroidota bacterium]
MKELLNKLMNIAKIYCSSIAQELHTEYEISLYELKQLTKDEKKISEKVKKCIEQNFIDLFKEE